MGVKSLLVWVFRARGKLESTTAFQGETHGHANRR
jgi:hypothetical protein